MSISNIYHRATSSRHLKRLSGIVHRISAQDSELQFGTLVELQEQLAKLRLSKTPLSRTTWLIKVFALVRALSARVLHLRHHDVQLLGGLVLAEGNLAEMRTGEGKTLTIAAPCIAAALSGQPVHVVTVNEYLAQRDAETLRPLYEACGLTVGVIKSEQSTLEKQAAYACDIVYGVNSEFGFDYLRDNQVTDPESRVQRGLGYVVVDEIDSVLIDEARTPLIISGSAPQANAIEHPLDTAIRKLQLSQHFIVDEKERSVSITESGYSELEHLLVSEGIIRTANSLYAIENLALLKHATQALTAHWLYQRNKHYVVRDGEVVIVDESTGRLMAGRRWGEGLHEAVEAKEGVDIQPPTQTRATITYQNFFGMYERLSGLTGTAATEAEEFAEIYGLHTITIPTHKAVLRHDLPDIVFPTESDKWAALVHETKARHANGQPVLIGTGSVAESELVAELLRGAGLMPAVLNARQNEQEAAIIAKAGMPGAITVATNMAGRGTDIILGGHREDLEDYATWQLQRDQVIAAGGLHVIGAERHESRRVDNQLRGRAGRQGDIGSSQFFISLEDRLLRLFAAEKNNALRKLVSQKEGISHSFVSKAVAVAQQRLERQGFQARLQLMKYDGALSAQRKALYALRNQLLSDTDTDLQSQIGELARIAADAVSHEWLHNDWISDDFDTMGLKAALKETFEVNAPVLGWMQQELEPHEIRQNIAELVAQSCARWGELLSPSEIRKLLLVSLDVQWVEHLTRLDELKSAISLRTMAQVNPVFAFTQESKLMFEAIKPSWAFDAIQQLKAHVAMAEALAGDTQAEAALTTDQRVSLTEFQRHIRRNELCPCESGKRYKHCHGLLK